MPPTDGLKVARSSIHGYGLYVTRRFVVGEIITHAEGVVWQEDDEFDDTYALVLPSYTVDAAGVAQDDYDTSVYFDLVDQTRWINHSCEPNTEVDAAWDAETGALRAWWVALRDLEPGDELLYDYAFSGHIAQPCACDAASCRGLIVDPDPAELAAVPEHLMPLLRLTPVRHAP